MSNQLTHTKVNNLKKYLNRQPLDVVYLFGSQAKKKTNTSSDLDIAILFSNDLPPKERFQKQLELIGNIGKITGFGDKVDIVPLEEAPLSLKYQVIKQNLPLVINNKNRKIHFEFTAMQKYLDRKYYRDRYLKNYFSQVSERGLT